MQRDVEGLVELLVGLEVLPLEEPRNEDQVAGRGDGKELGRSLDDAEDERLPVRQRARAVTDSGDGQADGDGQRRAGNGKDADSTHGGLS